MPSLVVYVPEPGLAAQVDLEQLRAIHPDTELLTVPYVIEHQTRTAREQEPFSLGLREAEAPLTAVQQDAFGRAEIILALDVPMDIPEKAPRLRWIQAMGSGVGQFVSARLPEAGIVLTNAAGVGAPSIAEWVVGRILQIFKRFPEHDAQAGRHEWRPAPPDELEGRVACIVGFGAIGQATARRLRPFGVHIIGVRRQAPIDNDHPDADEIWGQDALIELLARSDIIVVAAPGTAENENLFDLTTFSAMRRGAIFLNVARGTLVDENALCQALESGSLKGAAIDVTRAEPLPADSPLWTAPNLLISPHSSVATSKYGRRVVDLFYRNVRHYVNHEPLENVVALTGLR
jgi:phosphoglycerate dehydrogenase-like enzyme